MASGTGNLPNQGMDFTPFDILTAEEMDDLVENIESLADGSGIGDEAVTPEKRSGGFAVGVISGATLGTTGNKAITGLGFTPKLVRFTTLNTTSTNVFNGGWGAMDESGVQFALLSWVASTTNGRISFTDGCIGYFTEHTLVSMKASYVSMDNDGFTINVSTANNAYDIAYEAYA